MARHESAKGKIAGAIVVIIVVVLAAWWYFSQMPALDLARRGPAPERPASASSAPEPIEHPISEAQTEPAGATSAPLPPLPALDASDGAAAAALADIPGAQGLADLLIARGLIPHLVAAVDALSHHGTLGSSIVPLRTPQGTFAVSHSGAGLTIDPANYARYTPYMRIVEAIDARRAVSWYVRWYPLFQQAYRQLGYPRGYFNDRLMATLDDLLAAPNVNGPVQLVAARNGHYALADPTWESLSAGQKLMIRMGPENERALKIKLNRIRALLLGKAPAHSSGDATPLPPPA
ncbi:MAG TPA: DUF3014 domain-containing protein [Rhodanobacteraceae bacterium]|nr:DUF3014 domain-containing protein [Rhodanobacteraceae bacterium]